MKFIWRAVVLFILPGVIFGGCLVDAFFRLSDSGSEILKVFTGASLLWTLSAGAAMLCCRKVRGISRYYYPVAALMTIGFSLGIGLCRQLGLLGWYEGAGGIIVSGAAAGWVFQAFCSETYRLRERLFFLIGIFLSGGIWLLAAYRLRLTWMETLFFWLCELLLLCWLLASPLTKRGQIGKRWCWRVILAGCMVAAYWVSPEFSYRWWKAMPTDFPDALWVKTTVTPQGNLFTLVAPNGEKKVFTAAGRLTADEKSDEALWAALAALKVCRTGGIAHNMRLAAPEKSRIPAMWKKLGGRIIRYYRFPESIYLGSGSWKKSSWGGGNLRERIQHPHPGQNAEIFLLTALPENPYPAVLKNFLEYNCQALKLDGVVAVTGNLLKNPTVFEFLNERFAQCAVLPAPGNIWIFSNSPVSGNLMGLEKKLDLYLEEFYNGEPPIAPGCFSVICTDWNLHRSAISEIEYETPRWGGNSLFRPWWMFLVLAGIVSGWRFFRLFAERRNVMFTYLDCVENSFVGMSVFLLAMGLLIVQTGIFYLAVALLGLIFFLSMCKCSAGGIWGCLLGMAALLPAVCGAQWGIFLLPVVMIQAALAVGAGYKSDSTAAGSERRLCRITLLGILAAAVFMLLVWGCKIPLLAVWAFLMALRLPVIWQTGDKRVY